MEALAPVASTTRGALFCFVLFLKAIKATYKIVGGGFKLQLLFAQEKNIPQQVCSTLPKEAVF